MKTKLFDQKAKEAGDITLKDEVFKAEVKESVLAQYVFAYLSNQRQSNAHTKDRSEVAGSGKKPWRQKGTGKARVGTKQNPLWKGGGVAFGPRNNRNWKKNMNKKFRQAALRQSLSKISENKAIKVLNQIKLDEKKPLTKQAQEVVKAFGSPKKMTLVTEALDEKSIKAFNNIKNAKVIYVKDLNAYDVLNSGMLLIEDNARKYLESKLIK